MCGGTRSAQTKTATKESDMPIPTKDTGFEVIAAGQILRVAGLRLRKWIEQRRSERKGPPGVLFSQRPTL